ncbi:MAG: RNA methyltransferase [Saprospiraceae bacterium]|nr:RNA methyltransferase [Saprospiraceae bacterium]
MSNLPDSFLLQMRNLLGTETDAFLDALKQPAPVSIQLNPQKVSRLKDGILEPVPWYPAGCYLPERPVFTLDPLFHAGAYYVQEAASMLVAEAVRQITPSGHPLRALDLCAAPGGKSTLMASVLPKGSFLLSNEVIRNRYQTLQYNVAKWGITGMHTSQHDSRDFKALQGWFDLVLVDAPCSGEGLFRKDPDAVKEWSPAHTAHCSARQRRILAEAAALVRPGGVLIYCTCTYNDGENDTNASWLLEQDSFQALKLFLPAEWGLVPKEIGYQCYPHRVRGEGFYIACFQREGQEQAGSISAKNQPASALKPASKTDLDALAPWLSAGDEIAIFQDWQGVFRALPEHQVADCMQAGAVLRQSAFGVPLGLFKGKDFLPAAEFALSTLVHPGVPRVELEQEQALHFLKKDPPVIHPIPQGWMLVEYEGLGLGWAKGIGNRINNYYPKEWRILMQIR